jgi:HSP20 family molecular chaperone IbpA
MAETESKELKIREKQELTSAAEQTRAGLVFTPHVDIYETDKEIILMADMPGVKADNLTIDLRDDILTLTGDVEPLEGQGEEALMIEYEVGKFYRQFTLSEVIDQAGIDAKLIEGVLRLALPKVEKATPRKIEVTSG